MQHVQRPARRAARDFAVFLHLGKIAHPPQQPVGDARRAARAAGDFPRAFRADLKTEDAGRARDDSRQFVDAVEIQPLHDAETVAQGRREQSGAGGRPDQSERRQIEFDRARRGPFADHDVQLIVFHGRVEDFLDRRPQAMNLVDEQHIALAQIGQNRGQIGGFFHHRSGGAADRNAHLVGDDARQRGLAETGRTENQGVVERLGAFARRADEDFHLLFYLLLADVLAQQQRPQRVLIVLGAGRLRIDQALFLHQAPPPPGVMLFSASRINSSASSTPGCPRLMRAIRRAACCCL